MKNFNTKCKSSESFNERARIQCLHVSVATGRLAGLTTVKFQITVQLRCVRQIDNSLSNGHGAFWLHRFQVAVVFATDLYIAEGSR